MFTLSENNKSTPFNRTTKLQQERLFLSSDKGNFYLKILIQNYYKQQSLIYLILRIIQFQFSMYSWVCQGLWGMSQGCVTSKIILLRTSLGYFTTKNLQNHKGFTGISNGLRNIFITHGMTQSHAMRVELKFQINPKHEICSCLWVIKIFGNGLVFVYIAVRISVRFV